MGLTRRFLAGILSVVLALGLCSQGALAAAAGNFTLGVYFTADLYGAWCGTDPNTEEAVEVNYLKVVSAMAAQGKRDDARLLIDAGNDAQGPSASYQMNMEQGETDPVALSLRYAGYDAFLAGSCERELSPETRGEFYDDLTDPAGTLSGAPVAVLQGTSDGERESRTAPFLVRSVLVSGQEFRVGLVSLEESGDWQDLREGQNCNLMIATVPSGISEESAADLAGRTAGLDLILMKADEASGAVTLRDSQGKRVPVVQGGGGVLTRTEVTVTKSGSFAVGRTEKIDLAARPHDDGLGVLLAPYYETAKTAASQELGLLSGDWDRETGLSYVQSDTMNLIHEAQLWATGADLSIAAPQAEEGFCMRRLLDGQKTAAVSRRTCYTIYPNANDRLLTVEMTGEQLKTWMENSAGRYIVEADGTVTAGEGVSQAYGMSYTVCLGNPAGSRVTSMTYQGKPITTNQTFRVAVSEGCLAVAGNGGDTYPVVAKAAKTENFRAVGGSVAWILGEYIRSLSAGYKQVTPPKARSRWTVTPDSGEVALATVTRLEFVERVYDLVGRPSAYLDLKQTFHDIGGENPAAAWSVQAGIVQGNGNGQFRPNDPISREQAAIMLLRFDLARDMGPQGSWAVAVPYTDATEISAWASEAVMWNVIRGYLPEDEGGNFRPQEALTALELSGILERVEQLGTTR